MRYFLWNREDKGQRAKDEKNVKITLMSKNQLFVLTLFLAFLIAGSVLEISFWWLAAHS